MSKYSVKKPITVLMGTLIIIVLGLFSLIRLPLTLFPDVNLPFVVTVTSYIGASPEEIERDVTNPLEAAVSTVTNFSSVSSQSNENFAISFITFQDGTNLDSVSVELREIIDNINFPENVDSPNILRISPDLLPVMTVTIFKSYDNNISDEDALVLNTEWLKRDILPELESVTGVSDVQTIGEADIVLEVDLDLNSLDEYGLSEDFVLSIINQQNESGLVGAAVDEGVIRLLYLSSSPDNLNEVRELPITFFENEVITLQELSTSIKFVNQGVNSYSKVNGQQGIQVQFLKQSDVEITEVTNSILKKLQTMMDLENAQFEVLVNQGEFIENSINSVFQNLLIGGLLAIGVLLVFLRDLKPTIIVGLAIPISVIAAFLLMFISGITLNIISMGGLALGIGMLVDNAVVVIENIYRMLSEGKTKVEAAIYGAKEVSGAIVASTITTAAVFLPIFFIEGLVAEIFIPMALTIAFSLGASLLVALTLVPSMSSKFLSEKSVKKESSFMSNLKKLYKKSVLFSIKHKFLTTFLTIFLLIASTGIVISRGFILLPPTDEGTINVDITFINSVEFETKAEYADRLTEKFLSINDVDTVSATVGGGFVFGPPQAQGSGEVLSMTLNLSSNRSSSTKENSLIVQEILSNFDYDLVDELEGTDLIETAVSTQDSSGAAFGPSGISITLRGYNLFDLENISNDIVSIMRNVEGVEKPDNGIAVGADRIILNVDKNEAIKYSMTNATVIRNINAAFNIFSDFIGDETLTLQLEGISYELNIPSDSVSGISFDLFGDYVNFFSGIQLFDDKTLDYLEENLDTSLFGPMYIPNLFLPTYVQGEPIRFVLNPGIHVILGDDGEIISISNPGMGTQPLSVLSKVNMSDPDQKVLSLEKATGFATIFTDGNSRFLDITASIADGYNVTLVSNEVVSAVKEYLESDNFTSYGSGYQVEFSGENEEINTLFGELSIGLLVAILIVYMVMAIQFQSLKYPLIILGTIPLAFTGGMLALLITGENLSLVALVGFVILVGIVVNNGIVLIDYINQLREKGKSVIDSIVIAGQVRLRPIFMTALTTILALFILALGIGEGSELLQPLAITAIGGLLYATLLTLLVVPMIYALFNRKQMKREYKTKN